MSNSRPSLNTYLALAKDRWQNIQNAARVASTTNEKNHEHIYFVTGNESAGKFCFAGLARAYSVASTYTSSLTDLDSLTSAILYGYLEYIHTSTLYIPIANIPREDIKLRLELLVAFHAAGIIPYKPPPGERLATLTDAELEPLQSHAATLSQYFTSLDDLLENGIFDYVQPSNTTWVLVDHNASQLDLGRVFAGRVKGIIDHHRDEGFSPDAKPRIIHTCGSCMSLVVHRFDKKFKNGKWNGRLWDEKSATFAMGAILIDTRNMKASDPAKLTKWDRNAMEVLMKENGWDVDRRDAFYNELASYKGYIDALSVDELLRKDYKPVDEQNHRIGTSVVQQSVDWLSRHHARLSSLENQEEEVLLSKLAEQCLHFARVRALELEVVMGDYYVDETRKEFKRTMMLVPNGDIGRRAVDLFEELFTDKLELRNKRSDMDSAGVNYVVWDTKSQGAGRKVTKDLLVTAMRKALEE